MIAKVVQFTATLISLDFPRRLALVPYDESISSSVVYALDKNQQQSQAAYLRRTQKISGPISTREMQKGRRPIALYYRTLRTIEVCQLLNRIQEEYHLY